MHLGAALPWIVLVLWAGEIVCLSFLFVNVVLSCWGRHIEVLFVEGFSGARYHCFYSFGQLLLSWSFSFVVLLDYRWVRNQHSHFFALFAFGLGTSDIFELFLAFTFIQFLMKVVVIFIGLHRLFIAFLFLVVSHFHELWLRA